MTPTYNKHELIDVIDALGNSLEGFESLHNMLMEEITWYDAREGYQIINYLSVVTMDYAVTDWGKDFMWFADKISQLNMQFDMSTHKPKKEALHHSMKYVILKHFR